MRRNTPSDMAEQKTLDTVNYILANVEQSREVYNAVYRIKPQLVRLTLENTITEMQFYRISSLLTPQARSPLWERYFIQRHNCLKISAKCDSGDFEKNGIYYEFKVSGYNQDAAVHIVQIRLWQGCDYVVQSVSDVDVISFVLRHSEMEQEVALCGATSAHGTRTAVANNQNIELRMTLKKDGEHWARWRKKYTSTFQVCFP